MRKFKILIVVGIILTGCSNGVTEKVAIIEEKNKSIKDSSIEHTIIEENN